MSAPGRPVRSILVLTGFSFGQLALQFAFQILLAAWFGAGSEMDAFVAAQTVPLLVSAILAGSLGFVFVPAHARVTAEAGDLAARNFTRSIATMLIGATVAVAALGFAVAPAIRAGLVPGFEPQAARLTERLLRWLVWLVPLQSLAALARSLHQSHGRFAITGFGGVAGSLAAVASAAMLAPRWGTTGVAIAVLLGTAAGLLAMLPGVAGQLVPVGRLNPAAKRCLVPFAPLLLAALLQQADAVVDRHLASRLSAGTVSHLGYATRLTAALLTVGSQGLAFVAFPAFARHVARGDEAALSRNVALALRGVAVVFVPLVLGLACFAEPVVRLLFQRRAFEATDTRAVAVLVVALGGFVAAGAVGEVLGRLVYARNRVWIPVRLAGFGLVLGAVAKLWLAPVYGVIAIAATTSAVYVLNASLLVGISRGMLRSGGFDGVVPSLMRSLSATVPALLVAHAVLEELQFGVVAAAVIGAAVYAVSSVLLGERLVVSILGTRGSADSDTGEER